MPPESHPRGQAPERRHSGHEEQYSWRPLPAWVEVHQHGGEASILLALITTVIGFVRLRQRRELWIGAAALTVLLVVEAWLGGLVSDGGSDSAAAVHVPLALAIMALTVWLPLRARQAARS